MKKEDIFFDVLYDRMSHTTDQVHFVDEISNVSNICRYMDLPELIYLIKDQKLEFKQLALFEDLSENRIFLGEDVVNDTYQTSQPPIDLPYEKFLENVKSIQDRNSLTIYGLCFTLNYDNKYMWDHYTDKQIMVKVENIQSLAKSFDVENSPNPDIFIEQIQYVDTKNLHIAKEELPDYFTHPYSSAFIKDEAYEKEREIRAICQIDTIYTGKNVGVVTAAHLPPVLQINTNPNQFIKEIVLSPYLPESKQEAIKSIIKSLSPHLTISQSQIESIPHLYKKLLRKIDFTRALPPKVIEPENYKQITIDDNGTYKLKIIKEKTFAS